MSLVAFVITVATTVMINSLERVNDGYYSPQMWIVPGIGLPVAVLYFCGYLFLKQPKNQQNDGN